MHEIEAAIRQEGVRGREGPEGFYIGVDCCVEKDMGYSAHRSTEDRGGPGYGNDFPNKPRRHALHVTKEGSKRGIQRVEDVTAKSGCD